MRFCDTLTSELIVARMAKALRKVENLGTSARLIAYANAGIPSEQIRDFDDRAWTVEEKRRKAYAKVSDVAVKTFDTAATFVVFGVIFATLYLVFAPDRAFAADVATMPPAHEWAFIAGLAAFVFWVAYLCTCAVWPRKTSDDVDTRPHGDTTGYDRTPGWRR